MLQLKTAKAIFKFSPVAGKVACVITSLQPKILFQTITESWESHYDILYLRYATKDQLLQAKELFNKVKSSSSGLHAPLYK